MSSTKVTGMLNYNKTTNRCLILLDNPLLVESLEKICRNLDFTVEVSTTRKNALQLFMQYRHYLFIVDAKFLPRFPFRLLQMFKMAHRTPGVIILNSSDRDLTAFKYLGDEIIEIVSYPFLKDKIIEKILSIEDVVEKKTKKLFAIEFMALSAITIPLLLYLCYLLSHMS